MEKIFLPKGFSSLGASTTLRRKSFMHLLFSLPYSLVGCCWIGIVSAQSIPIISPFPQPAALQGSYSFSGPKVQIPYLEELRQIHSLKQSYDSLYTQLITLKEISQDTALKDSAVSVARLQSKVILDREKQTLENMIAKDEIPDTALSEAISSTLEGNSSNGNAIERTSNIQAIESLMDTNGENLKALTNEWLMPKIEQQLNGNLDQGWDPVSGNITDYFGTGGLMLLEADGNSAQEILAMAKEHAAHKGRHISDQYLRQISPDFRKLKIDALGEIQVSEVTALKQKSSFFEPNSLAKQHWLERTGFYVWYDPLTPITEGVHISSGLSYGLSQQLILFAGGVFGRKFRKDSLPLREGNGVTLGIRVSKNNWFSQANLTACETNIIYPEANKNLNFEGKIISAMVGVGRTMALGSTLQSTLLVGVDPLHSKGKSLSASAVQIKLGLEFGQLFGKGIK